MTVRLRGRLPAEELNGLARVEEALVREPRSKRIVIGVATVYERRDHGDGEFEPTVELEHLELLDGKLRDRGVKLLQAAHSGRTGSRTLFSTEEEDEAASNLPATTPPVPGPRFLFEPGADSKWWLVYRAEDGALLARSGPVGIRADLTLGRTYTLEQVDALGDDDLSLLARQTVESAERAEAFEDAVHNVTGGGDDEQVSQYVGPDGVDEASAYGGEPDENEDGDEPDVIPGPIFSDRAKETTEA